MTEHEAVRYKDAIRLHHTLEVRYDPGPTSGFMGKLPPRA